MTHYEIPYVSLDVFRICNIWKSVDNLTSSSCLTTICCSDKFGCMGHLVTISPVQYDNQVYSNQPGYYVRLRSLNGEHSGCLAGFVNLWRNLKIVKPSYVFDEFPFRNIAAGNSTAPILQKKIKGLAQNGNRSIANALGILQSCNKPSICPLTTTRCRFRLRSGSELVGLLLQFCNN